MDNFILCCEAGPFIDFSSLSLVVVATSSVSLAVYSQYVGPLSFGKSTTWNERRWRQQSF